ncbi:acyl-CoA dehydrogenase family protein [Pseudonocardia acaciae]|uniref:acyl-CoA dehydrogenase family protein n=1 Tax=Pseudonocardia acaciae TaxID=551276 RepID=UPI001FDFFF1C|nr:acyl-CoA dehydrogenase family protein [Pseudonocardia acaciae]
MASLPEGFEDLRAEVRDFLAEQRRLGTFEPRCDNWHVGFDPAFSRRVADRGWVGMTMPAALGGGGRSAVERLVVTEELVAAGAPLAAHWVGDRQVGPSLLRHGSPEQQARFVPAIAGGGCYFALGLSEPDAGSDLAAVRTSAERRDGAWVLNGAKVWSSHAHRCDFLVVLCRTSPRTEARHDGLSQFIVPLDSPGVRVRPIRQLDGRHHFNEVLFSDVRLLDGDVVGRVGEGWAQMAAELAYERSGPERFLSTFVLLQEALKHPATGGPVREVLARIHGLRMLAYSVARQIDRGEPPSLAASLVKDLGTRLEQHSVSAIAAIASSAPPHSRVATLYRDAVRLSPSFTLRGGTNEVLRSVIMKGLLSG